MLKQVQHDKGVTLILDGAHNDAKMRAFLTALEEYFPNKRKTFIVGFKKDKNIKGMLSSIGKYADELIITEFNRAIDVGRRMAADAIKIKNQISGLEYKGNVFVEKDSKKALKRALALNNLAMEQFSNGTVIVVTGSLYLVGEVRSML